jgi:hypothetical protein
MVKLDLHRCGNLLETAESSLSLEESREERPGSRRDGPISLIVYLLYRFCLGMLMLMQERDKLDRF